MLTGLPAGDMQRWPLQLMNSIYRGQRSALETFTANPAR